MQDILVYASNYAIRTRSQYCAARIAAMLQASLTGIFAAEPLLPLPSMGMPPLFPEIGKMAMEVVIEARAAGGDFVHWALGLGVAQSHWQVAEGHLAPVLAAAANWHDLLVLEFGVKAPWSSVGALGAVLLTCGIPCLVVPDSHEREKPLDTIVVASHGSAESIRAAHAALPLLKRAKRVVLVQGTRPVAYSMIDWKPPLDVEGHLSRHGIEFSRRALGTTDDREAGAELLRAAFENDADMLVMGAYGRTRFSEWVLGGATRHVLEHGTIPLFMRH